MRIIDKIREYRERRILSQDMFEFFEILEELAWENEDLKDQIRELKDDSHHHYN